MNQHTRETKQLQALREARREVDEAAARHMAEAARLLHLAEDLHRRIVRQQESH